MAYLDGVDVTDTSQVFGRTVHGVEVVLTPRTTDVSGTVIDKAGVAVVHCGVTMFSIDREHWFTDSRFLAHTACGRGGAFALGNLPPGEYWLAAVAGAENTQAGEEWKAAEFLEALAPAALRIRLVEGQKLSVNPRAVAP